MKKRGLVLTTLKGYDTLTMNKNAHASLAKILKSDAGDLPYFFIMLKGRSFQREN